MQLVWFLAPTVDLCTQQWDLLRSEIPAVEPHIKLLQGNDGVEKWKDKKLWDYVLKSVRVVVSTPQILLEALSHGFVRLARLSLLVFDEGIAPFLPFDLCLILDTVLGRSISLEQSLPRECSVWL
jgi:ERCC4-related helicase